MKIKDVKKGERLDKFLVGELGGKTRSQIQKDIEKGLVLVSGEEKSSHYKLKEEDIIEIRKTRKVVKIEKSEEEDGIEVIEKKKRLKKYKLIFENEEFIIVNKPAGLIVHGAEHIEEKTLADQLLVKYPELITVGEDETRPGIVHRLDKDASGIMVIARTNKSFKNLKKQFQTRMVRKRYMALVFGQVEKDCDEINFPIKRASAGNKQAAVPGSFRDNKNQVREAITTFDIEKKLINYTLLKLGIRTGRKHQIRVHMSAYGHPVVGDPLYNTKRTREFNKKIGLGRIFLVATELSFKDISRKEQEFKITLPSKLKEFLKNQK